MVERIGNMLLQLRKAAGVSQEYLGRGLASVAEISKLENGGKETDCFLMEALFQRLGKSMDKLEMMVSDIEYQFMLLRAWIVENYLDQDDESVEVLLEEYGKQPGSDRPLHRQFVLEMRALICKGNKKECIWRFGEALEVTLPRWREESLDGVCLCTQEIRILLLLLELLLETEEYGMAKEKLWELLRYLERNYTDAEEKAKVYPQCAWLLGKTCCGQADWGTAYEICTRGIGCLVENGVLTVADKLLELQGICLDKMNGCKEKQDDIKEFSKGNKIRQAIAFLYEMTGSGMPREDFAYLLLSSGQREILVNRELLKDMRRAQGLSQERLSEGICSWETLSRIESGKRGPNKKNLYRIYRKMGLDRERYYGYIQADDFTLYEKVHKIHSSWVRGNRQGADILAEELTEKLDMDIPANRQFIETHRLMSAVSKGSIPGEEAISEAERILRYTMKDYQGTVNRTPFRQECVILNLIALCLRRSGRMGDALQLWGQMLDRFGTSKVVEQHHSASLMLVYTNYAGSLEVNGCLEKAEEIGMKGIQLALKCQRADTAAEILANLACVYEKRNTQEDGLLCEECLRNSSYLLYFYKKNKNGDAVKRYYEKKYGRLLD